MTVGNAVPGLTLPIFATITAFEHPTVTRGLDAVVELKRTDPAFRAALTE